MTEQGHLEPADIIATLREIADAVQPPLWLFGGVAVDFIVGRWTRPHGDIDLNARAEDREAIARDLGRIGYATPDTGWLTHWHQAGSGRVVEVVFLESCAGGVVELVIRAGDPVGTPGRYPMPAAYLDPERYAELNALRFRICSPAGEWLARSRGSGVVAGREPDPKHAHDRRLLESWLREHGGWPPL